MSRRWFFVGVLALALAACTMPTPAPAMSTVEIATAVQATLTALLPPAQLGNGAARTPAPPPGSTALPAGTPAASLGTPAPQTTPTPFSGRIEGLVWHDVCPLTGAPANPTVTPLPYCKDYAEEGYAGDGVRQADEPGIGGVTVQLLRGECPGMPMTTTQTDAEGRYVFAELSPGKYCVVVDPVDAENVHVLGSGVSTYPSLKQPFQTVVVAAGKVAQADFGWSPAEACEERMEFISENYPDGSEVTPGDTFTKEWVVKNTGTCTWTPAYTLVHTGGEDLGAPEEVPLPMAVPPGGEVTLSVPFVAPHAPGTYRSEWRLQTPDGEQFGPGEHGEGMLWVEIEVPGATETLDPGPPTMVDSMDNPAGRWFLLQTNEARFEVGAGELVLHGLTPGMLDSWGMSTYPPLKDAFIEATFVTGAACSGLDRYGLIVRAPSPAGGVIVEFSCDGRYRVYTWDGTNFTSLQRWTHAAGIHAGPNSTNRLGVWLEGNTVRVYANRVLVGEVHQHQFSDAGLFGLVVASTNTPDFTVAVDEVSYWSPLP